MKKEPKRSILDSVDLHKKSWEEDESFGNKYPSFSKVMKIGKALVIKKGDTSRLKQATPKKRD